MSWTQRVSEFDGRSALIFIDDQFRDRAPISELPRLAWFGVYCRLDPGGAFWHPDETEQLDAIEHDLLQRCGQLGRGWAVYVLQISTRGIREYFIYFGGSADLSEVVVKLRDAFPEYRLEYDETTDVAWNRYTTCLPNVDST